MFEHDTQAKAVDVISSLGFLVYPSDKIKSQSSGYFRYGTPE